MNELILENTSQSTIIFSMTKTQEKLVDKSRVIKKTMQTPVSEKGVEELKKLIAAQNEVIKTLENKIITLENTVNVLRADIEEEDR